MIRGMKPRLVSIIVGGALAACGGKQRATTAEAPPTPCRSAATHLSDLMRGEVGAMLDEKDWPKVAATFDARCTNDGWAPEVVACMQAAAHGPEIDACADKLTEGQNAAMKAAVEADLAPLIKEGAMRKGSEEPTADGAMEGGRGGPTAGAPPAPAPPSGDPCGGGE